MGCSCKNKTQNMAKSKKTAIQPQSDGSLQIQEIKEPPYTWEEVIAVKDYLNSRNKTEEGRLKLVEFNKKHYGEEIGYCDQPCMERTRKRLDRATELLQQYESLKKQK